MSLIWTPEQYRKPKDGESITGKVSHAECMVYWYSAAKDHMIIPMLNNVPIPADHIGYVRVECTTPQQIEAASRKFAAQKQREFDIKDAAFHLRQEEFLEGKIKDLQNRMLSADCRAFEKDFIRGAIERIRQDKTKHRRQRQLFLQIEAQEAPLKRSDG